MSPPLLPRPDISGLERNVDYHWINFQGSFCEFSRSKMASWSPVPLGDRAPLHSSSWGSVLMRLWEITGDQSQVSQNLFSMQEPGHNLRQNHLDFVPVRQHSFQCLTLHDS